MTFNTVDCFQVANVADAGVVDAATMQKMAMPRCGVADMQITGSGAINSLTCT